MSSEPLSKQLPLPPIGINIGHAKDTYPFEVSCSALWRGYVGHWEIKESRLYLLRIEGRLLNGEDASVSDIFPNTSRPVFADWYSGKLICSGGNEIGYLDDFMVYEEDLVFTVRFGVILGREVHRNEVPKE
ncbi:hypothetical protein [Nitrosospira briensis]|uniref:hypothetical protein n=1 Tax=Nitrosospira briensis TaxID=35799 RepID=UPI0008F41D09|nr:hypothetical protein [Nitrosospira briensis]SFO38534.1 hypothetical protein SAMN05216332_1138 [Nitrosospira briensis]